MAKFKYLDGGASKRCPKCGKKISPSYRYCPYCGTLDDKFRVAPSKYIGYRERKRPKGEFTKRHLTRTREVAREMGHRYGMAIIKTYGEKTWISGNTKGELQNFARIPLARGDYLAVKIVKVRRGQTEMPPESISGRILGV